MEKELEHVLTVDCHGACYPTSTGVEKVETNVEAKTVVVTGSASAEDMLAALKRWGTAANKSVELAA